MTTPWGPHGVPHMGYPTFSTDPFEYVVKPILMYGCEIWGTNIKEGNNCSKLGGEIWERFHLRVCKNILGVHKSTSNLATLAEIGRYPIANDIHKQMVKYLLRFDTLKNDRLVKKAYEQQKNDLNSANWVGKTKLFLDKLGLTYIHREKPQGERKLSEINRLSIVTKNRENEIFEQSLIHHMESQSLKNEGKLIFYNKLKNKFGQEDYLHIENADSRKNITRLRLSAHRLKIEVGRHKSVEKNNRICMHCRTKEVESEHHFLFICPNYNKARKVSMTESTSHEYSYK